MILVWRSSGLDILITFIRYDMQGVLDLLVYNYVYSSVVE